MPQPNDAAVKKQVAGLLHKLAADPANGIAQVIDKNGVEKKGGDVQASFWVDFTLGYEGGRQLVSAMVTAGSIKGTHGYFPDHPEMRASFFIDGPGIPKKGSIGEIDMRRIAPTVAKILDVPLPAGTGSAAWREAYTKTILPRLREFAPDLLILSAGFDAHKDDPVGGMHLDEEDFAWLTREMKAACPRIVSVLEGGYDINALANSVRAHLEALSA